MNRFKTQLGFDCEFIVKDIRDQDFQEQLFSTVMKFDEDIDIVVGGPPCQGFSLFGSRNESDPRNNLFRAYLKVIALLRPKYFVMENVPGLALMYKGEAVRKIFRAVDAMHGVRYNLSGPIKVNASAFGVPQARERILFIGSRYDVHTLDTIPPLETRLLTAKEAIDDLSFLRAWESKNSYHDSHPSTTPYQDESRRGRLYSLYGIDKIDRSLSNHDAARHTPDVIARFAMMEPGKGFESIPRALWDAHVRSDKKWCERLAPDKPAYTVTTLPDDFVHYRQHRILTVREWARLQSFDDTFTFLGPRSSGGGGKGNKKRNTELPQYTQIGNAVPPLLAKGIGAAILQALGVVTPSRRLLEYDFLERYINQFQDEGSVEKAELAAELTKTRFRAIQFCRSGLGVSGGEGT